MTSTSQPFGITATVQTSANLPKGCEVRGLPIAGSTRSGSAAGQWPRQPRPVRIPRMGFLLETAVHHDPYQPYIVGGAIFVLLMIGLRVVFGVGKSRPHS